MQNVTYKSQYWQLHIHRSGGKELEKCADRVQDEFRRLFRELAKNGCLEYPYAKKMEGHANLFEVRVRTSGQYRALYSYISPNKIIIVLLIFRKESNKTPRTLIQTALQRLRSYNAN